MPPEESTTNCARCSTPGSGRYCTECGAPLSNATCRVCNEPLTPGSKFCHGCGATAGATGTVASESAGPAIVPQRASTLASTIPWAVAGIAFLALFAMLAGRGFNAKRGSAVDAPATALPNPALDGAGPSGDDASGATAAMAAPFAAGAGVRAPDISKMSPTELADRLFNRIMLLNEQGKADSVQFFAPMGIQAYDMLAQQQGHALDADQRYHVAQIAYAAGALPMAKAQADTILQLHPDHLLGLLMAARVAKGSGNTPAYTEYSKRFAKVKGSELAKKLPEYDHHRREIDTGA